MTDKCLPWLGLLNRKNGYGKLWLDGKTQLAHRVAWQQAYGDIPKGMHVLHRCDNPRCVNPKHLFLGTQADNVADMMVKGRYKMPRTASKGSTHGRAKLTDADVLAIRASKRPCADLARVYNIGQRTMWDVLHRRTWKHLP